MASLEYRYVIIQKDKSKSSKNVQYLEVSQSTKRGPLWFPLTFVVSPVLLLIRHATFGCPPPVLSLIA